MLTRVNTVVETRDVTWEALLTKVVPPMQLQQSVFPELAGVPELAGMPRMGEAPKLEHTPEPGGIT